MIYIMKRQPPKDYAGWLKKIQRRYGNYPNYDSIPVELKYELKEQLIGEQRGLCCYCCGRLDGDNYHLEHYYPQTLCKTENKRKLLTDYSNLMISCNGTIGSRKSGNSCGHHKEDWYDEKHMISPLQKDCEEYFMYAADGTILSRGDKRADFMINRLGLNEYKLKEARKNALIAIGYFDEDFDPEFAAIFSHHVDEKGQLPSFCNIIRFFAYFK
ncbi:MAG TPA: TIGR02646 family protein [Thermotogota bacterium]|nr:TIGR02646 family protein [Thermotogota bacterium]